MRLVYFRKSVPNFGDDLNALLWPALMPRLFDDDPASAFLGIGTIIGMPVDEHARLHVFSSGAGYDGLANWAGRDVRYRCVRGPLSARLLGLEPEAALSDGAILTPLAEGFPSAAGGGGETLVIPHYETIARPGWPEAASLCGFGLVDPRGAPGDIVARIAGARLVLTESLHGAIIADTYGVPWIAFATSKNFGPTKWVDWRQSLGEEFQFTVVPPPDARHVLDFGRAPWPIGAEVSMDAEAAMAAFRARVAPAAAPGPPRGGLRQRLKSLARASALARRLLGFSVERTAAALTMLALTARPSGSSAAKRAEIQQRMLERLHSVAA
jgi:succinoglycan biosynthesis protein ExoV